MSEPSERPDLGPATPEDFQPAIGQTFEARPPAPGGPLPLVLAGIRRRTGPLGFREAFSLEFLGPRRPAYGQGMYRLSHPRVGDLEVSMVPAGVSDAGVSYEVSFG